MIKRLRFFSFLLPGCVLSVSLHHRFSLSLLQQQAKQGRAEKMLRGLDPFKKKNYTPTLSTPILFPSCLPPRGTSAAQLSAFHKLQGLWPHSHKVCKHQGVVPGGAVLLRRPLQELVLEIHACSCCSPIHALPCLPPDFLWFHATYPSVNI